MTHQYVTGYLDDPDATSSTIDVEGWLHTGDIGYVDDDDEVFIVDRVKELIKFKGFQVNILFVRSYQVIDRLSLHVTARKLGKSEKYISIKSFCFYPKKKKKKKDFVLFPWDINTIFFWLKLIK